MAERGDALCLCGSGQAWVSCCDAILSGRREAATAEALMRSRYTAFLMKDVSHLLNSWHPDNRPEQLQLDSRQRWLGLKIVRTERGTATDDEGVVEFVARYKIDGRGYRLHEISRFRKTEQGWQYLDGARGASDSTIRN